MASRARVTLSGDLRAARIRHVTACLTCTLKCVYCALPVRLSGPDDHPGYGVVEQVPGGELVLLHRFCRRALGRRRAPGCAVRRAHLGRATEQYDTGRRIGRYERLGVRPVSRNTDLFRKRWRMAKMRYACKACRYYTGSH
jgi:hypothetical protein